MKRRHKGFSRLVSSVVTDRSISSIIRENPRFKTVLEPFDPVKTASLIGGLLTLPSLHANTLRLEMLIHLVLAYSRGDKQPTAEQINSCLNAEFASTSFIHLEDPIEDVFLSNVITGQGNSRIFNGIWENNDFYIQLFLNIIKTLPEVSGVSQLRADVHSMLRLSEEIAARRNLDRYCEGGGTPAGDMLVPADHQLIPLCRAITFTSDDLSRLGIQPSCLAPYTFDLGLVNLLRTQLLDNSELVKHPIVTDGDAWHVILPNSISMSLRIYILEWMAAHGYQRSFNEHLAMGYRDLLIQSPLVSEAPAGSNVFPIQKINGDLFIEFAADIDAGTYLHIIALVDNIEGYFRAGFSETDSAHFDKISSRLGESINETRSYFRKQKGFRRGFTIVVVCGYGRPYAIPEVGETSDWMIEYISAPDFQTFGWSSQVSATFLYKLLAFRKFMSAHGISFLNPNGLLNLYGWFEDTHYLLSLREIEFGMRQIHISPPTDSIMAIRKKVRQGWDVHSLPLPNGQVVEVRRKFIDNYFDADSNKSLYACLDAIREGRLLGVCVGKQSTWWVDIQASQTKLSRDIIYQSWDALINWMARIVTVLERIIPEVTNALVVLDLNDTSQELTDAVPEEALRSCVSVSAQQYENTIRISLHDPFIGGFHNPKNIAERLLVNAVLKGASLLGNVTGQRVEPEELADQIVQNDDARFFHMFDAIHFRDYIPSFTRPQTIFIDSPDEAETKLGLAWLVPRGRDNNRLSTVAQSKDFLNAIVDTLWVRIRTRLKSLNRIKVIEQAFQYLDGLQLEKERWELTARAVSALINDDDAVSNTAIRQIGRCNASSIALRVMIEMALSECPLDEGVSPAVLDLTRLMSDILAVCNLGGWSDAIVKGVMDPEIELAANGDILSDVEFRSKVYEPHGRRLQKARITKEIENYDKRFDIPQTTPTVRGIFPDSFLAAYEAEFGFSIDTMRMMRDKLEDYALEKKKQVLVLRKDEVQAYFQRSGIATTQEVEAFLNQFSLWPRAAWDNTPDGFRKGDWYPWRFGRRLSLVARPLVRLEDGLNPRFLISPGSIADGTTQTLSKYYEADIATSECSSPLMRRWIDDEKSRRSHDFAARAEEAMRNAGYDTQLEITVSNLLNEKTERDFGDVDVLAWKPDHEKVFAIECKDLRFAKTPIEIAEQLNRFTGQVLPNGDRDDLLIHLDRCEFLRTKTSRLAAITHNSSEELTIQPIICFSLPVPILYVAQRFPDVIFLTIDDLPEALHGY